MREYGFSLTPTIPLSLYGRIRVSENPYSHPKSRIVEQTEYKDDKLECHNEKLEQVIIILP